MYHVGQNNIVSAKVQPEQEKFGSYWIKILIKYSRTFFRGNNIITVYIHHIVVTS